MNALFFRQVRADISGVASTRREPGVRSSESLDLREQARARTVCNPVRESRESSGYMLDGAEEARRLRVRLIGPAASSATATFQEAIGRSCPFSVSSPSVEWPGWERLAEVQ